jgi:dTDP-4-dehydrorhamnose 3,5-epimerase
MKNNPGGVMANFTFTACPISGLYLIENKTYSDARGSFMETFNQREFAAAGITAPFVQENQSQSVRGVLRGLHFQKKHPQGKLIRAIQGEIYDVAVDIRSGSLTYGKWHAERLSEVNRLQFYIPPGFAHGFLVLSEIAIVAYKCTDFYNAQDEGGIRWDDPELGVTWPLNKVITVILSEKDQRWGPFIAKGGKLVYN